jgi:atypical dual specificity phosphatase
MGCRPYWVRKWLGGCGLPEPGDEKVLASKGVTLLISLVEPHEFYDAWPGGEDEFLNVMREVGIEVIRIPTPDFTAPDVEESCRAYERIKKEIDKGGKVVVHCYAGIGRTGTFIAGYLVWSEGLSPEEAEEEVLSYGAGPQSEDQHFFLYVVYRLCRLRRTTSKSLNRF